MFRIDFFEWYGLLERTLVHLFGVFGVIISANATLNSVVEPFPAEVKQSGDYIIGDSKVYGHRFHANVLQALDQPSNPLHNVLGQGVVRAYLGVAKEFRNRWKDVEEDPTAGNYKSFGLRRYERIMQDLRLEEMMAAILTGLEHARVVAENEARTNGFDSNTQLNHGHPAMEIGMDDEPWEAVEDAMDCD